MLLKPEACTARMRFHRESTTAMVAQAGLSPWLRRGLAVMPQAPAAQRPDQGWRGFGGDRLPGVDAGSERLLTHRASWCLGLRYGGLRSMAVCSSPHSFPRQHVEQRSTINEVSSMACPKIMGSQPSRGCWFRWPGAWHEIDKPLKVVENPYLG